MNLSENFVDPTSGAHTQKIEGSWGGAKRKLRRSQTTNPDLLETHIVEVCWRRRHKTEIIETLISAIRRLYPVV